MSDVRKGKRNYPARNWGRFCADPDVTVEYTPEKLASPMVSRQHGEVSIQMHGDRKREDHHVTLAPKSLSNGCCAQCGQLRRISAASSCTLKQRSSLRKICRYQTFDVGDAIFHTGIF